MVSMADLGLRLCRRSAGQVLDVAESYCGRARIRTRTRRVSGPADIRILPQSTPLLVAHHEGPVSRSRPEIARVVFLQRSRNRDLPGQADSAAMRLSLRPGGRLE